LTEKVTSQTEEFLESIYRLQERNGIARTSELVKMLKVVPGTVTNTVERLEKRGLVIHETYKGVRVTEKGRSIALRVLRRHRLSERLLTDILRMKWNQVHDAACILEHGVTEEVAKSIEKVLGWPQTCPHGNPIPTRCGGIIEEKSEPLPNLQPGEKGIVMKITDENRSVLEQVERFGLKPGAHIEMLENAFPESFITVRIDQSECKINPDIASVIRVKRLDEDSDASSKVKE